MAEAISVNARSDTITSARPTSAWFKASLSSSGTNNLTRALASKYAGSAHRRLAAAITGALPALRVPPSTGPGPLRETRAAHARDSEMGDAARQAPTAPRVGRDR